MAAAVEKNIQYRESSDIPGGNHPPATQEAKIV